MDKWLARKKGIKTAHEFLIHSFLLIFGRMLSEAQTLMYLAPELAIYPGVCIIVSVIGFGLLGDGLRDITDPRLSGSR